MVVSYLVQEYVLSFLLLKIRKSTPCGWGVPLMVILAANIRCLGNGLGHLMVTVVTNPLKSHLNDMVIIQGVEERGENPTQNILEDHHQHHVI
jgi:hypothetical protein